MPLIRRTNPACCGHVAVSQSLWCYTAPAEWCFCSRIGESRCAESRHSRHYRRTGSRKPWLVKPTSSKWFISTNVTNEDFCVTNGYERISGWWFQPLWKILTVGIIIPNIWKNKKCSKPPIRYVTSKTLDFNRNQPEIRQETLGFYQQSVNFHLFQAHPARGLSPNALQNRAL